MKIKNTKILMINEAIYIDESGFNLYLHRSKRYAEIRYDARLIIPNSKGPNITMICAISKDRLIKVNYYFGSITGEIFYNQMTKLLILFINNSKKNFICDNSRIYYIKEIESIFNDIIYEIMYLILYSP